MRFPTILATLTTAVFAHEGHNHNPAAAEMNEAATVFLARLAQSSFLRVQGQGT